MKYLSILFILIFALTGRAADFVVTRDDDRDMFCNSGVDCSLREAVNSANADGDFPDTISFALPPSAIINLESRLVITKNVNITGPGARLLTITGDAFQVIVIQNDTGTNPIEVGISRLTVADCNTNSGEIFSVVYKNTTLNLSEIAVRDNIGVAILNNGGILNVSRSTISNNTTSRVATILGNVDVLTNEAGIVNIDNSTISNNTARLAGGILNTGDLTLNNVTISNNTATDGSGTGGVYSFSGTLKVRNSIIASNNAAINPDIKGLFVSLGNNLIGNSTGGTGFIDAENGDQVGTAATSINPLLGVLKDNGGQTDTRALLPGSPAINAGNNEGAAATDQRGLKRLAGGIIDIGAYEVQPPPCTYSITPTTQNFTAGGGIGSITVTTQPGCSVSPVSSDPFITITSGTDGSGDTTVTFSVAANTKAARTGTIFIADQIFTVTQNSGKKRERVILV